MPCRWARTLRAAWARTRSRWACGSTLGVGLMVGAATSVAGVIGFVGLIAPHLVRARVDFRPGATLVPSMLVGAALVLGADIVVRPPADGLRTPARRLHLAGRRAVAGARGAQGPRRVARRMSAIAARALVSRRGDVTILDRIDLAFAGGEVTAIVGPNGAGKTTLLRHLVGLDAPACRDG